MRHILMIVAVVAFSRVVWAVEPVAVATVGDLDAALVERARAWTAEQLAIPAPFIGSLALEKMPTTLDEVAEAAAPHVSPDALGLVVLFHGQQDVPHHGIYRPDLRVVVVNVRLMLENTDEETAARRLERQVIRGVCTLMGLEFSPNPESAMAAYSTMEELDAMARNLDPPWLLKLQERALELGIPLNPESPFNMFREIPEE